MPDSSEDRKRTPDKTQKIVSATKTRPGGVGRTAFYILLTSLGLVAIVWIALEIWAYGNVSAQ